MGPSNGLYSVNPWKGVRVPCLQRGQGMVAPELDSKESALFFALVLTYFLITDRKMYMTNYIPDFIFKSTHFYGAGSEYNDTDV